jgi:nitrite reductase/ring-hydroxylating ferredoxin subunit
VFHDVAGIDELSEGSAKIVTLAGREIGLFLWRDDVFAIRNICPHQLGPVCAGYAMPMLVGDTAGLIEVDEDKLVVVCPWHNWEFDARSGRAAWADAPYRLKTYPVKVEGGRVLVDAGRAAEEAATKATA